MITLVTFPFRLLVLSLDYEADVWNSHVNLRRCIIFSDEPFFFGMFMASFPTSQ